jgi:two-component system OmpR family response regulator
LPWRALNRILLVDDDPDVRSVAALALQAYGGFTVAACGSAAECLAAAAGFGPDLIILDVVMPEMNGIETLEALRGMPATAATPVVFMTASAGRPALPEAPALRALGVIMKPFEPTALPDTVRRMWDASHAPAD